MSKEGITTIVEGKQRQGKTLLAVNLIKDEYENTGRTIYSNIPLTVPYIPINYTELVLENEEVENSIIFIDELNFYFDCRESMTKVNKNFARWLLQSKKSGNDLIGTSHSLEYLDLRFRNNYDLLINVQAFPVRRTVGEDGRTLPPDFIKCRTITGPGFMLVEDKFRFIVQEQHLGLYDTKNRVDIFA